MWHHGAPRGCRGFWPSGGVMMHWGAGRKCRYSGASMNIGGIRGMGTLRGCQGCIGELAGECRC